MRGDGQPNGNAQFLAGAEADTKCDAIEQCVEDDASYRDQAYCWRLTVETLLLPRLLLIVSSVLVVRMHELMKRRKENKATYRGAADQRAVAARLVNCFREQGGHSRGDERTGARSHEKREVPLLPECQ